MKVDVFMVKDKITTIIFDLDNTLILWKEEYGTRWIRKALEELKISYDEKIIQQINQAIMDYQKECVLFTEEGMTAYIRRVFPVPDTFLEIGSCYLKKTVPTSLEPGVYEALTYLKEKYNLVVLTNWFQESQAGRLETVGIRSYFSHVYGVDNLPMKPAKEVYDRILETVSKEECLMIGDDPICDGMGASSLGMQVLLYDREKKYKGVYPTFSNFLELKQLL